MAKPDGLVVVDAEKELEFLHDLPVELMWGVGPVTKARLAEMGVHTIGQLAQMPGQRLERLLGRAVGEKLGALAWNRDPREIRTHHRAQSAGAQSALGRKPAESAFTGRRCGILRTGSAHGSGSKSLAARTVTVRVRFADLRSVTRSLTLRAPISATAMLAEIAEELVRGVLAKHANEKSISLLAISVSKLEKSSGCAAGAVVRARRREAPAREQAGHGRARVADGAIDRIRDRFGWEAVGYGSLALGISRSVPDEFRELAEKEL